METYSKKTRTGGRGGHFFLEQLAHDKKKYHDYEYPRVSVVIPSYNAAHPLALTIESLMSQEYQNFEVLVIDGGSTDRTLESIRSCRDERIRVFSVSTTNHYEMINKGISQSSGEYLNMMFPGDYYLLNTTLRLMMELAMEHEKPHLLFCGSQVRDGVSGVHLMYRHLTPQLLKEGQQPTSLQSCWFRKDLFHEIGKFHTSYTQRGGYELLCRFSQHHHLKAVSTNRVLTDYDIRWVTSGQMIRHFTETLRVVFRYFGFWAAVKWVFIQKDTGRFVRLWFRSLKTAFLGQ